MRLALSLLLLLLGVVGCGQDELIGRTVKVKSTDISGVISERHPLHSSQVKVICETTDGRPEFMWADVRCLEFAE